jgi:hypothetical protein
MSGGDYDGDTFLVIWAEGVMGTIGDVAPPREEGGAFTDGAVMGATSAGVVGGGQDGTSGWDCQRLQRLIKCRLESRNSHTVETAAILWKVYADKFGAKDKRCIDIGGIYCEALDAAKTGSRGLERRLQKYEGAKEPESGKWWPPRKTGKSGVAGSTSAVRKYGASGWEWPDHVPDSVSTSVISKLFNMLSKAGRCETAIEIFLDEDLLLDGRGEYKDVARRYLDKWNGYWTEHFNAKERKSNACETNAGGMNYGGGNSGNDELIVQLRHEFENHEGCLLLLASAVYECSYRDQMKKQQGAPRAFCWKLCGKELNQIKAAKK